ncbi:MAG: hypothetical protein JXQ99_15325 [Hyphomicrobiaceae bacterium]
MDFKALMQEKRDELRQLQDVGGIDLVLRHLEAAERHFLNARRDGEAELFTDVIYRTNQVFEGILKESYQAIALKDGSKNTPAQIENYLSKHNVFRPRVLEYFTRYRKEWRNAATHDHRLDFDEQEAFLAYSTVCAFCFAALNQMIQAQAALSASQGRSSKDLIFDPENIADLLVAELPSLMAALMRNMQTLKTDVRITETAVIGAIEGLFQSTNSIPIVEPLSELANQKLRPDLVLNSSGKFVVLEIKTSRTFAKMENIQEQLSTYAAAAQAIGAVGVVVPAILGDTKSMVFEKFSVQAAAVPTFIVRLKAKS